VFSWREAVDAIAGSYGAGAPRTSLPPRTVAADNGAWLRTLPALPPGGRYFGAKLMGTAATSAAALDRLAPAGPVRLAVLGSGLEASMHVRAFAAVRRLERVAVFSPTVERREAFAAAIAADLGVATEATDDAQAAVARANVVLAAARSHGEVPILFGEWLPPTATVLSIGSTVPSQRELDAGVIAACDLIVCDDVEEVTGQTGDMLEAARNGIDFREKTFSLHELLAGKLDERLAAACRPLFKSVGGGLQDIVVAEVVLRKALAAGAATPLPIEFETKR
jgi:alanine dehydrogenase